MAHQTIEKNMLTEMHRHLGWVFALGSAFALLGIAGLYFKLSFTDTGMRYLGVLLLIAGVIQCVDVYKTEGWLVKYWRALAVIMYFGGGMMMLVFPDKSSSLVSMLFGIMLVVIGIFRLIIALRTRHQMKLWLLMAIFGGMSMVLGGFLLAQWPWPATEILGTFVSIELLLQGTSMLYMGSAARSVGH